MQGESQLHPFQSQGPRIQIQADSTQLVTAGRGKKNVIASAFSDAEKDKLLCDRANPSRGDDQPCLIVRQTFWM